jgi:carbonic anhydrase/acetyltransferase-like protein (isoleucine patch superfamily)
MAVYELDGMSPELPEDDRYWIAPSASVIGRVRLGADANIWWGSVLRGDNELIDIGARVNIQDNCTLHTDPGFALKVAADATVGHAAILHGCSIGECALIGMGATVLNGARVGRKAILGAHALVAEGKEIPDMTLAVGAPARVVRPITEEENAFLEGVARLYVDKWRRYRRGLRAL